MSTSFFRPTVLFPVITVLVSCAFFRIFYFYSQPRHVDLDFGFDLDKVVELGIATASRSWEFGATAEALLELRNPELTVFDRLPFAEGHLPTFPQVAAVQGLQYIKPRIWTNGSALLADGEGSSSDPASLGIPALLLSTHDPAYYQAATRQAKYLIYSAPRFPSSTSPTPNRHKAISHRDTPPQLWGDFIYMVPPFLAYHSVASNNLTYFHEAVRQCELYREALITDITTPDGSRCRGLWRHIVNDPSHHDPDICCIDPDVWLTSNAWAVAGMVRVLATVEKCSKTPLTSTQGGKAQHAHFDRFRQASVSSLLKIITEMLTCTMAQSRDPTTDLLRNYLDDAMLMATGAGIGAATGAAAPSSAAYAFGDVAGTALMTSAIYRLAVLRPREFATEQYLAWADRNYRVVARHVDGDGKAGPVATPYEVPAKKSLEMSPEGQSMVVLMAAAWRDCVREGVCFARD